MLKMILCLMLFATSATFAQSTLSFGNWDISNDGSGFAELMWSSNETVAGFQFDVVGASLTSADDGITEKLDWIVSNNSFRVIGVAIVSGTYIPPQEDPVHLITLHFENVGDVISFTEVIFVNKATEAFEVDASDEIIIEPACPADINGDSIVGVNDLLEVVGSWGEENVPADINGDGDVNVTDLLIVVSMWGPC
jgi:hypothetical protein